MTHSLRLRLLVAAAVAVAAALALSWLAMTLIFERHIERRVADELRQEAVSLLAGLRLDRGVPTIDDEPDDPRFATPASGLYWQVRAPGGTDRSRSLWDTHLPDARVTSAADWTQREAVGPFGQQLLLIERRVRPDRAGPPVTVQLGYDLAQLRGPQREFGAEMGLYLALLWGALAAAFWLQVRLGLRPLGRINSEIARLRRDPSARFAGDHPREMQPLVSAIDALAEAREADLARARRRAADLAHGLKTPLAALAAQSRRAREAGAIDAALGLDRAVAAIRAAIDGELARTRVDLAQGAGREAAALPLVERLVQVIEHSELGERCAFAIDVPADLMLPLAGDDAAELVGPLLENAVRHARRQVSVAGRGGMVGIELRVGDDGPGLDADRYGAAVLRGARLDSAGDGHGLGLAIARELAEATGGELTLGAAALGGLEVRITWPARD